MILMAVSNLPPASSARRRTITALLALPIALALIYAGHWWFLGGVALVTGIAGLEFSRIMERGGYRPMPYLILTLIFFLLADSYWPALRLLKPGLTLLIILSLLSQLFRLRSPAPTVDWALTLAGGLYIGWGMAHLVALRQLADGLSWVLLALFATWGADTLAYFVGRSLGRHKLWPRISPKKSWEGFAGGVIGSVVGGGLIVIAFPSIGWQTGLVIAGVVTVADLFGDLAISMMKRHVGVKDTSNLLPGHGGFLDRMDSVLLVSMVVYYYAIWIG